jgi:hypothetical protein
MFEVVKRGEKLLLAGALLAHIALLGGGAWVVALSLPRLVSPPPEPLPEAPLTPRESLAPRESQDARGRADGKREAKADLAQGILGWRTYGGFGYRSPESYEQVAMVDILADDFGVTIKAVGGAGCIVPPDASYQRARESAYNAVMLPALKKRHGNDVMDVAQKRAGSINAERQRKHEKRQREAKTRKNQNNGVITANPWSRSR